MKASEKYEVSILTIEPPKIVDLLISKQTHYYVLWAGYTGVQFTAASFGSTDLSLGVAIFVLIGVWAFNLGHLGFVLQCVQQLNKLDAVLAVMLAKTPDAPAERSELYEEKLREAFTRVHEGVFFWKLLSETSGPRSYRLNTFVHLLIDTCASAALLGRVEAVRSCVIDLINGLM